MRLILFVLFYFYFTSGFAQNCLLKGMEPVAGSLGYQSRGNGDHCEGLVTHANSAGVDLEVVSFTKGSVNFYSSNTEAITIKNLLNSPNPISVTGLNFNMSVHYRLDFGLPTNAAKTIDASTVIAKVPILKENMGVYGYVNENKELIFCPVKLSSKKIIQSALDSTYILQLLKNVTFKTLEYRYASYKNGDSGRFSDPNAIQPTEIKNDRILIRLPNQIKGGTYLLKVYYTLNSGFQNSKDFIIRLP
ncbi:MAG: hypothetical protein EOP45_02655 [Sphingobacteriaceae bacterium]|nr:MAG: hypothetical protein EOP45_02655 [Sphingobacteriaceae bacterium]